MAARIPGGGVRAAGRRHADRTARRPPGDRRAYRRFDAETAELKRIWTDSNHRRRGYAKLLLDELESEITRRGYRRVYLTTGDRQPEAEALYESAGYSRLAEPLPADGEVYPIAFAKTLAH